MKFLIDTRQKSLLLDETKTEDGSLIDGKKKYEAAFSLLGSSPRQQPGPGARPQARLR
jgi:hypothetical protein